MSILIDGVAIPTDEEIRATPAPWFDHDRAKFHEVIRNAIAERERQNKQEEFVRQWEEQRYSRQRIPASYMIVIKDGIEYVFEA